MMRYNQTVTKYITKHRILQNDMVGMGCEEIVHETIQEFTLQYILQGLRNVPENENQCAATKK